MGLSAFYSLPGEPPRLKLASYFEVREVWGAEDDGERGLAPNNGGDSKSSEGNPLEDAARAESVTIALEERLRTGLHMDDGLRKIRFNNPAFFNHMIGYCGIDEHKHYMLRRGRLDIG